MADWNHLQENRNTPLDATCLLNNTVGEKDIGAPKIRNYFGAIMFPHIILKLPPFAPFFVSVCTLVHGFFSVLLPIIALSVITIVRVVALSRF